MNESHTNLDSVTTDGQSATKKRVLIVDDDLACARILKAGLERTGSYDVRVEGRAKEAVSAAREFGPDMILLDVCMIDGDGGDVAFQLRNNRQLQNIPIVFATSIVSEEEAQNGNAARGAFPFLAKPVRLERAIACIEKYTGTRGPANPLSRGGKST
jgi:two-component system OmpR family response regulator